MPSSRREDQRQQRADARQRILEAASELLEERRWNELRLEDVMAAAGLSRTVFYRHFDDRATLLLAMLEEILQHIGATGTAWKQGGVSRSARSARACPSCRRRCGGTAG